MPKAKEFELLGFDDRQALAIAKVWHQNDEQTINQFQVAVQQQPAVRYLMRVPLLLNLALRTHQYYKTRGESFSDDPLKFFPTQRGELYEHCLYGLLKLWPNEKKTIVKTPNLKIEQWLSDLARAAYNLTVNKQEQFTDAELLIALELEYNVDVQELLDQLLKRGVLVRTGGHDDAPLMFLHRTFQEFLTAKYLKEQIESKNKAAKKEAWIIIDEWSWEPERDVITTLLAGKLNDPKPLIEVLADKEKDGHFRGRLALAAHCLEEIDEKKRVLLHELIDQITEEVWQYLWQRLHYTNNKHIPKICGLSKHIIHALSALGRIDAKSSGFLLVDHLAKNNLFIVLKNINSKKTIQHLSTTLNHSDSTVRRSSINALGKIGSDTSVKLLSECLCDSDEWVRDEAANALAKTGSVNAVKQLIKCLGVSKIFAGHDAAAKGLGKTDSDIAVPLLIKMLDHSDKSNRMLAAEALGELCFNTAAPQLIKCLNDPDSRVRERASSALGKIGSDTATPHLIKCLIDSDCFVRNAAVYALGNIGSDTAIPHLIKYLNDSILYIHEVSFALGQIGSDSAALELIRLLSDSSASIRYYAVSGLKYINSNIAASQLILHLSDSDDNVQSEAVYALSRIDIETEVPQLIKLLGDSDSLVRYYTAKVLGRKGYDTAAPQLIKCLNDPYSLVRQRAASALGKIGSDTAVSHLSICLSDAEYRVRRDAVTALGEIGSNTAVSHLIKCLSDSEHSVRRAAVTALGKIGSDTTVSHLIKCLSDSEYHVRMEAAIALEKTGPDSAVQQLIKCLGSSHYSDQNKATNSLKKIITKKFNSISLNDKQRLTSPINNETSSYTVMSAIFDIEQSQEIGYQLFSSIFENINIRKIKKNQLYS